MPSLDLATLFKADKLIAVQPDWSERDSEGLSVVTPLQIEDIIVEGRRVFGFVFAGGVVFGMAEHSADTTPPPGL